MSRWTPLVLVGGVTWVGILVWSVALHAQEPATTQATVLTEGHRLYEPDALSAEEIGARLERAFGHISALSQVEVKVEDAVVILSGSAPRPRARLRAEAIAWRLPGVLDVENLIEVVEPVDPTEVRELERTAQDEAIQEQLTTIFDTVAELRDIGLTVERGVVQLRGTVPVVEARQRAEDFAAGLEGVIYVANHIELVRTFGERLEPTLERAVEFLEEVLLYLPLVAVGAFVIILFALLARLVTRIDVLYRRLSEKPLVQSIVRQIAGTAIMLVGILLVLEIFNITTLVGAVLGTAGLAGLALGFAFRDIAENYLASIMLSLRRPFHHNDWIRIDEHDGKVVRLTTRETVLMTLDGEHVRIPNAIVFKSIIHNYTRNPRRRFCIEMRVAPNEDLVQVRSLGVETLCRMKGVMTTPPPFSWVEGFGDSDVKVGFYGWVQQADHDFLNVRAEARRQLKAAFDKAGVEMPDPTFRVKWADGQEARLSPKSIRPPDQGIAVIERQREELDEQIEEERRKADEPDLLEE